MPFLTIFKQKIGRVRCHGCSERRDRRPPPVVTSHELACGSERVCSRGLPPLVLLCAVIWLERLVKHAAAPDVHAPRAAVQSNAGSLCVLQYARRRACGSTLLAAAKRRLTVAPPRAWTRHWPSILHASGASKGRASRICLCCHVPYWSSNLSSECICTLHNTRRQHDPPSCGLISTLTAGISTCRLAANAARWHKWSPSCLLWSARACALVRAARARRRGAAAYGSAFALLAEAPSLENPLKVSLHA